MTSFFDIFPLYLVLLTAIFIIIPTFIAAVLRRSLYNYLIGSANKVSRLLSLGESRGKQPAIVDKLETRFYEASQKLENVNTIALIDGLYSQERVKFLGISLRCEQWDYFCQTLPNLLLGFGLLGTFIGISSNLYSVSQTLDQNSEDINKLVTQLQTPLQNMGIAFFTSLIAILCSSILIIINLRCNTNFAKALLISSLEDYLDNVFKVKIRGYSRLDKAVDRMVSQQQDFLERFHDKVQTALEASFGKAANQMVASNKNFQNNVDSLVSRFNDITSTMAKSTDGFQEAVFILQEQVTTVNKIVPQFEASANKLKESANTNLKASQKIEDSKFYERIEQFTTSSNKFVVATERYVNASQVAEKAYTELQKVSSTIKDGAVSFHDSAESLKENVSIVNEQVTTVREIIPQFTEYSDKLVVSATAYLKAAQKIEDSKFSENLEQLTADLANTQKAFANSTESLENQIQQLATNNQEATNLAKEVYTELKETSTTIKDGAVNFTKAAATFQETDFANKLASATQELITIPQQFNESTAILHQSTEHIATALNNISNYAKQTTNLIDRVNSLNQYSSKLLEKSDRNFETQITQLKQIVTTLQQHQEAVNNGIENFREIFTNFLEQSENNHQELHEVTIAINNLTNKLQSNINKLNFDRLNQQLLELTKINQQQEKTINSGFTDISLSLVRLTTKIEQRSTNNKQENQKIIFELQKLIEQLNNIPLKIDNFVSSIKQQENQIKSNLKEINNSTKQKNNEQIEKLTDKFDNLI